MLLNQERAEAYMRRCGVDALVATSPANITYFTDYYCWLDPLLRQYMVTPGGGGALVQNYAVLPLEGEPALVVRPNFAVNAVECWVRDIHFSSPPRMDHSIKPREPDPQSRRF